jgi:membrane protein DedA with SNARE-associated domain
VEELLIRFGPLAIFLGAALEGDATLVLAGVVAHLGLVSLPAAVVVGCLGALVGDCLWYGVGRVAGPRIRRARVYARVGPFVERLANRFGLGQIVLARFVYGTRVASMIFWGLRDTPFARFAAVDLIGCGVWAGALVPLGFCLSHTATAILGEVEAVERWFLGALVLVATGAAFFHVVVRRRLRA